MEVSFSCEKPAKIVKWKVSPGTMVSPGKVLLLYKTISTDKDDNCNVEEKLRSKTERGLVSKFLVKPNEIIQPGQGILLLEACKHNTVMSDLCADCGVDLRVDGVGSSQASISMVHSIPELKVCPELAQQIGKEDEQRLLKDKKLALLVDLDQTIVHTTNDDVDPNVKDVYHYKLPSQRSQWYHTRLRPHTRHFLTEMSKLYELHICTFGVREYAHTVAALLDKNGELFSHRILSRNECFDPGSKYPNLKALFPCGDEMVCIIDDREDVWQGCRNLVQVKPYFFFQHSANIHAPPGMNKVDDPTKSEVFELAEDNEDDKNGVEEETCQVEKNPNSTEISSKIDEISLKGKEDISSKVDSEDKIPSNVDAVEEMLPKVDDKDKVSPKVGNEDEISKVNSKDETPLKDDCKNETCLKIDSKDETVSKVDSEIKNAAAVKGKDEIAPKVDSKDETSPKVESDDKTSPKIEGDDQTSPKVESEVQTSSKVDSKDETSTKIDTDEVLSKIGTDEVLSKIGTDEVLPKIDADENLPKIDSKGVEKMETSDISDEKDSNETEKSEVDSTKKSPAIEDEEENYVKNKSDLKEESATKVEVECEDQDDYLLYLEDILRRIHKEFYSFNTSFYSDSEKETDRKSLSDIIPKVRARVLKGLTLTFSGLIPIHQKLYQSRAYKVALAFGAQVTQDLTDETTHLVAMKPGTQKVNTAKRRGNIKIVNPEWLWTCAERWEHVDERLYALTSKSRGSRIPPPHCSNPEPSRKRAPKLNTFANTINPLYFVSQEEINDMDKEVEEDMNDIEMELAADDDQLDDDQIDDDQLDDDQVGKDLVLKRGHESSDSDSVDHYSSNPPKRKRENDSSDSDLDDENNCEDDDDDDPVTRFRRGEDLPDDLDLGDISQDSVEIDDTEDYEDDREWNAMGEALEREFLSD